MVVVVVGGGGRGVVAVRLRLYMRRREWTPFPRDAGLYNTWHVMWRLFFLKSID